MLYDSNLRLNHLCSWNLTQQYTAVSRCSSLVETDRCRVDAYSRGQRLTVAELNSWVFQGHATLWSIELARPVVVYERILNDIAHLVSRMNIERVRHTVVSVLMLYALFLFVAYIFITVALSLDPPPPLSLYFIPPISLCICLSLTLSGYQFHFSTSGLRFYLRQPHHHFLLSKRPSAVLMSLIF